MPLSPVERRLCEHIEQRRDALLAELRAHVELPTGPGNGNALDRTRTIFCERLGALGADIRLIPGEPREPWLVPRLDGSRPDGPASERSEPPRPAPPTAIARRFGNSPRRVLLCGHLDTVHPVESSFRSLTLSPDGRTATGPGCVDMKGGLVILLAALEALDKAGIPAGWGVILNSDEETGSYHSDRAIRDEAAMREGGLGYAAGLVVEPALPDGSLVTHRPGSGQFQIDVRGTPAHVGRDFRKGASAVSALAKTIDAADRLCDPDPPPAGSGRIVNVGVVTGGTATNVVAEHARAWGNIRFPDTASGEQLVRDLHALARGGEDAPLWVRVRSSINRPAKPLTPETMSLAEAARAAAADLGQTMPFSTTGGVCDGNNMQAAGLPTIDTLGVRGGGLHTPQEWIELSSLVERGQLLALLIARLCGC